MTAVSCRYGAFLARTHQPKLLTAYFLGAGAATMMAAVGFLAVLGLGEWQAEQAPLVMLLPLAYLLAARLYRGQPEERALQLVADAATFILLLSSMTSAFTGFQYHGLQSIIGSSTFVLSLFFTEAAIYYGLAAGMRRQTEAIFAGAAMACAALWQLLTYVGVASETYTLTFAAVGLLLLLAYRVAGAERFAASGLAKAAFQSANVLLSLSFTASLFMGLSRLSAKHVDWSFVALCLTLGLRISSPGGRPGPRCQLAALVRRDRDFPGTVDVLCHSGLEHAVHWPKVRNLQCGLRLGSLDCRAHRLASGARARPRNGQSFTLAWGACWLGSRW